MISEYCFRLKKDGKPKTDCICTRPDLIENYDKAIADKTQTWVCHHRLEKLVSKQWLIEHNDYYNVSPNELIFLTKADHNNLHKKGNTYIGKPRSDEFKRKCSERMKGNTFGLGNKGRKGQKQSEEEKRCVQNQ